MFGRKTSTPPTPLMIPSRSRSVKGPAGNTLAKYSLSMLTPASNQSCGYAPSTNVHSNISHINRMKIG